MTWREIHEISFANRMRILVSFFSSVIAMQVAYSVIININPVKIHSYGGNETINKSYQSIGDDAKYTTNMPGSFSQNIVNNTCKSTVGSYLSHIRNTSCILSIPKKVNITTTNVSFQLQNDLNTTPSNKENVYKYSNISSIFTLKNGIPTSFTNPAATSKIEEKIKNENKVRDEINVNVDEDTPKTNDIIGNYIEKKKQFSAIDATSNDKNLLDVYSFLSQKKEKLFLKNENATETNSNQDIEFKNTENISKSDSNTLMNRSTVTSRDSNITQYLTNTIQPLASTNNKIVTTKNLLKSFVNYSTPKNAETMIFLNDSETKVIPLSEFPKANITTDSYNTNWTNVIGTTVKSPFSSITISVERNLTSSQFVSSITKDPFSCKTISIERNVTTTQSTTSTSREHVRKSMKRITISTRNRQKSRKRTSVPPLKGNTSSNAGFIMVNKRYGSRLYFWFIKSQKDPLNSPLVVWLQGQPGWSSLYGLFEENGPYRVVETENGIQFELREFAWTKEFNVLYLDHCIGCGFSTAERKAAYKPTYEMVGKNVYSALVQFFEIFYEFSNNDLYLAGEHGGAKYIPVIAHAIHYNNIVQNYKMNLKGIIIGGPYIDSISMTDFSDYLYMVGLIDENERERLFIEEQHVKALIRASKYDKAILSMKKILYSKFKEAGYEKFYDLRYEKPINGLYKVEQYMPKVVTHERFASAMRTNDFKFKSKSNILIEAIMRPIDHILNIILQNYKVLYYNGQFDMLTPYSLTSNYFSSWKWSGTDSFHSSQFNNWYGTNTNEPDGYWKYWNNLTHVIIRNAGHTVGTTKSKTLFYLLKWFVNEQFEKNYTLPSPHMKYLSIFP